MAYLSLSTSNLPDPGVDPNAAKEPRDYFETFLYTGNGTGLQVGDVIKKPADTTTISNSLIFDDGSSTYLSGGVPGTSSSTYTLSMWFKRATITSGNYQYLFYTHSNGGLSIGSTAGQVDEMYVYNQGGGDVQYLGSGRKIKDTSKWYHVVMKVSSNSATVYLDGLQLGTATAGTVTSAARIGSYNASNYFDGYLAEIHFVDGTAHEPTDFGNFDANGIWIPKAVTGITYGTNGFYLDFADNTSTITLGADQTANNNDWTLNNLATTDQVTDSPTNNHMNLDSGYQRGSNTFSEGNLNVVVAAGSNNSIVSHRLPRTGKHYFEFELDATQGSAVTVGFVDATIASGSLTHYAGTGHFGYYASNGNMYVNSSTQSYGALYGAGDIIGVAIDFDAKTVQFYKNNTGQGVFDYSQFSSVKDWRILASNATGSGGHTLIFDFGQKGFTYTPPTGYLALSENNITVDNQNLESPDLVWIKNRDAADSHQIYDSVRGVQRVILSDPDTNPVEADAPNGLLDFNKNGFTIGSQNEINTLNEDYVAWCWKANGTGVSNTNGSITSTVSANTTSGFSIVKYTGTGANATVGHGLSSTPEMVIIKGLETAYDWVVWVDGFSNTQRLLLNTTGATSAGNWNTLPTSSVFGLGTHLNINNSGTDHIAYCFHSVDGFSKIGSYEGNGSTNGPFVYTGFRPAFIMVKPTAAGAWLIHDVLRNTYNTSILELQADSLGAEYSTVTAGAGDRFDILSNGFKSRTANSGANAAGTYIYMAFAETPFKYATAR